LIKVNGYYARNVTRLESLKLSTKKHLKLSKQSAKVYQFIELLAWWEGGVNATHLMHKFNISRKSATERLKDYRQYLPNNLIYQQSQKIFQPTAHFTPEFIHQTNFNQYSIFATIT
jgi:hypothetical protein